jgi:hypothetical protein
MQESFIFLGEEPAGTNTTTTTTTRSIDGVEQGEVNQTSLNSTTATYDPSTSGGDSNADLSGSSAPAVQTTQPSENATVLDESKEEANTAITYANADGTFDPASGIWSNTTNGTSGSNTTSSATGTTAGINANGTQSLPLNSTESLPVTNVDANGTLINTVTGNGADPSGARSGVIRGEKQWQGWAQDVVDYGDEAVFTANRRIPYFSTLMLNAEVKKE